jgi:hypothetical protein
MFEYLARKYFKYLLLDFILIVILTMNAAMMNYNDTIFIVFGILKLINFFNLGFKISQEKVGYWDMVLILLILPFIEGVVFTVFLALLLKRIGFY